MRPGYACCLLPLHFHLLRGDGSLECGFTRGCNGAGGGVCVYVGATLPLGLNVKDEGGSFTLRPAPCYMYVNFAFWLPML